MKPRRAIAAASGVSLALVSLGVSGLFFGCIEERESNRFSNRGIPVKPGAQGASSSTSARSPGKQPSGAPVKLPDGPVATPAAPTGTIVSEVRVGLVPLGTVVFDGQVLPIVSPDGRFIGVQSGEAPSWEHLLGAPNAGDPPRTTVDIFELTEKGPSHVDPVEPLPPGLMLGRGSDDRGVLVEQARADGTRRCGRLSWVGARVQWLTTGEACSAHGVSLVGDGFAWAERAVGDSSWRLRTSTYAEAIGVGDSCRALFPLASRGRGVLYVIAATSRGVEVMAFRLPSAASTGTRPFTIGSAVLGAELGPRDAYQAASTVQSLVEQRRRPGETESGDTEQASDLLFFHPGAGRMAIFTLSTGRITLLAPRTFAGAWMNDSASGDGVFLTTEKGLMHQRLTRESDGAWHVSSPVRILDEPFVPRETFHTDRSWVLVGPVKNDPARVQLLGMRIAPPAE